MSSDQSVPWWRDPKKWPFFVFLAIGAYFLWAEHEAHVIEFLPWILILACVGMHFFMHGGHGHGEHGRNHDRDPKSNRRPDREGGNKS